MLLGKLNLNWCEKIQIISSIGVELETVKNLIKNMSGKYRIPHF